jgi:hypothetical protein
MTQYENSLIAMRRLLKSVGHSYWARWIGIDLRLWRQRRSVSHHLAAYGGMGTFNDIWIRQDIGSAVTERQAIWADTLFEWLKAVCRFLAQHPTTPFKAPALAVGVGKHDPGLAAFVGGDQAPPSMRGYADEPRKLEGCRCRRCGHSETAYQSVEAFLADTLLPRMVFEACERMVLEGLVDKALGLDIPGIATRRRELSGAVSASKIVLRRSTRFMRPCPACGDHGTIAYCWRLTGGRALRFRPAEDNLPMRRPRRTAHSSDPARTRRAT